MSCRLVLSPLSSSCYDVMLDGLCCCRVPPLESADEKQRFVLHANEYFCRACNFSLSRLLLKGACTSLLLLLLLLLLLMI